MIAPFVTVLLDSHGPVYTYKNHVKGLKKGDVVVVQLPSGKYTCGQVESVTPSKTECGRATKYIVDKVDLDKHRALTALDPPPEEEKPKAYKWYVGV